jgi:hypothetical protein
MDMHSLNLFGVPLENNTTAEEKGSNTQTQKVLRDLIELTE